MPEIDYLSEDSILPQGQKYVCMSFLSDKTNVKTLTGIKIRGVFNTYEEACEHSKKVQSVDPAFNVYVGEMGKWCPYDPDPDSEAVKDSVYANEQLNSMMKAYLENQEKAKVYHEQRKNEMIRQNIVDNLATRKETLSSVKKELKHADGENKVSLESTIKSIEQQIAKMESKKSELDEQIQSTTQQLKSYQSGFDNAAQPDVNIGDKY